MDSVASRAELFEEKTKWRNRHKLFLVLAVTPKRRKIPLRRPTPNTKQLAACRYRFKIVLSRVEKSRAAIGYAVESA